MAVDDLSDMSLSDEELGDTVELPLELNSEAAFLDYPIFRSGTLTIITSPPVRLSGQPRSPPAGLPPPRLPSAPPKLLKPSLTVSLTPPPMDTVTDLESDAEDCVEIPCQALDTPVDRSDRHDVFHTPVAYRRTTIPKIPSTVQLSIDPPPRLARDTLLESDRRPDYQLERRSSKLGATTGWSLYGDILALSRERHDKPRRLVSIAGSGSFVITSHGYIDQVDIAKGRLAFDPSSCMKQGI